MSAYQFDSDFQEMIAALIVRDHATVSTIRGVIHPEYFTSPSIKKIVSLSLEYHKKYADSPTRAAFLAFCLGQLKPDEIKQAKQLFRIELRNKKLVEDQMVEFAQYSAMKEAVLDSTDLMDNYENRSQIRSIINKALGVGVNVRKLGTNLISDRKERYLERLKHGLEYNRISTGLKRLDQMLLGGLDRGELGLIMAAPKGFKTGTFVNFVAAALGQRKKVVVFTLEVSEDKYALRIERRISGLDRKGILDSQDKLDKALRRIESIGSGVIVKGFPMRTVSVESIYSHLNLLESEGFKADMVIIDYWDLLKSNDKYGEYRHQLATIGADMRAIAQEKNIAVWTGSQVNRKAVGKKVIQKDDIAEAFEKIAIVDAAVAICQTPEEFAMKPSRARLFGAANREGEGGGTCYISIDYDRMRIKELRIQEE